MTDAFTATARVADALGSAGIPYGARSPALSPEDLVVLKALFNRGKDWADIERILAAMGGAFDGAYARAQLVAHAGEDDPGVARLDDLLAAWASPRA